MKKYLFYILIILIMILSCSKDEPTPPPQANVILKMEPNPQTVAVGDSVDFGVKIEDAEDLFAVSMEIVFDSSMISFQNSDFVIVNEDFWIGETQGLSVLESEKLNVAIGLVQTDGIDAISEDGILFRFNFTADDSTGSTYLEFQNINLLDEDGIQIDGSNENDITIQNGELIIE